MYTMKEIGEMSFEEIKGKFPLVGVSTRDFGVYEEFYFFPLGRDFSEEERSLNFGVIDLDEENGDIGVYTLAGYEHDIVSIG